MFSLFSNPIDLAHQYWERVVRPGDLVIDATCGNGKDTLKLAQLTGEEGSVIGIDLQQEALVKTRTLLEESLSPSHLARIHLIQQSHAAFPPKVEKNTVKLIVYNLGYLPGGNKNVTTQAGTTLESVTKYFTLLSPGGVISVTCYPGHEEGAREEKSLSQLFSTLSPAIWSVCHHRWVNRLSSPSLFILQKSNN
jgi:predicted methyltransferase